MNKIDRTNNDKKFKNGTESVMGWVREYWFLVVFMIGVLTSASAMYNNIEERVTIAEYGIYHIDSSFTDSLSELRDQVECLVQKVDEMTIEVTKVSTKLEERTDK